MGLVKWIGAGVLASVVVVGAYQAGQQDRAAVGTNQARAEEVFTPHDSSHQLVTYQPGHTYYVETGISDNGQVGVCRITPDSRQEAHDWAIRTGSGDVEVGGIRGQMYIIGANVPAQTRLTQDMCNATTMHGGTGQVTVGDNGRIAQFE